MVSESIKYKLYTYILYALIVNITSRFLSSKLEKNLFPQTYKNESNNVLNLLGFNVNFAQNTNIQPHRLFIQT